MSAASFSIPSAEDRILDGLSDAQREAVLHGEGPLLIIAGAGTGKTTVLTRRIAHLIASKRAAPEEILALTFTEKAAAEMAERVDQLIPYGYAETWIGTFHAFGDRVLREAALEAGHEPGVPRALAARADHLPARAAVPAPAEALPPAGRSHPAPGRAALARQPRERRGRVARGRIAPGPRRRSRRRRTDEAKDEAEKQLELAAFYERHQRLLAEAGLVDFGDQIHGALTLLRARPALLARLRERYRYVLRRRVPGHEPRAARARAPAAAPRRRPTSPSSATTTRRSTAGAAPPPRTCWRSASSSRDAARWCSSRTIARRR